MKQTNYYLFELFIASPVAYWIARRSDKKEAALATARK